MTTLLSPPKSPISARLSSPKSNFQSPILSPHPKSPISNLQSPIRSSTSPSLNLARLFPIQWRQVTRFLAARGCPADWLEDLAQETFLRAWQSRHAFRSDKPESFDAYLRSIARNVLREARRADDRRPRLAQVPDLHRLPSRASGVGARSELAELLEGAKSELSDAQWQAIELTCLCGLTPRQAANEIGCSPAVLRNRLSHARKKIQKSGKILCDDVP